MVGPIRARALGPRGVGPWAPGAARAGRRAAARVGEPRRAGAVTTQESVTKNSGAAAVQMTRAQRQRQQRGDAGGWVYDGQEVYAALAQFQGQHERSEAA